MRLEDIVDQVLPRLQRAGVERLTLTGGEPFIHPAIIDICNAAANCGMPLGICTNATLTTDDQIVRLRQIGNVHINVSFDGFRPESHGRFRGRESSFFTTVTTTRKFAEAGLLQGLLSTPNALTDVDEFAKLCEFAIDVGAEYLLMNPFSAFGRGVINQERFAADGAKMKAIRKVTEQYQGRGLELVYIRFPNEDKPLDKCEMGKLIYVFTDGQLAVCPYLAFAARSPQSRYRDTEFLVGNVFEEEIAPLLATYSRCGGLGVMVNDKCACCSMNEDCGRGCPAAIISGGGRIGDIDSEQCPAVRA